MGIPLAKHIEGRRSGLKLNAINGVFPVGVLAQLNALGSECFSSTGVQCRAFRATAPCPQIVEFVLPSCCLKPHLTQMAPAAVVGANDRNVDVI